MTPRDEMHTTNKVNYTSEPMMIIYEALYIKENCDGVLIKASGSEYITIPKKVR